MPAPFGPSTAVTRPGSTVSAAASSNEPRRTPTSATSVPGSRERAA
ncbi:MAG: hypothetical protein NVV70_08075 [Cellulomonas sp.]|nr:hypothetical protein [Cellulomonas sp.]MCR6648084.1 hypothetical protein [Cellulomonas sp.]